MKKRRQVTSRQVVRAAHATHSPRTVRQRAAKDAERALLLTEDCVVTGVDALQAQLANLLGRRLVTLDVSRLKRIDTAGMQLLAAFVRERAMHDRSVQWRGESAALSMAAQLLGLSAVLGSSKQPPGAAARDGHTP